MDFDNPNPNLLDMMMTSSDNHPPNETQFMHELNCDINDEFDGLSLLDDDFLNDIINSDVSGEISNDSNNPPPVVPTPSMQVNESQVMHELDLSTTNFDTNDEFDGLSFVDDVFLHMFESNDNINNDVPGEIGNDNGSYNAVETTRIEVGTRTFGDNNGTSTIRVPVTPTISDGVLLCECCNLLRQLVHSDGYETNTLVIRGGVGFFCHAILEIRPFVGCKERRQQTLYLKDLTIEEVKVFIEDYCLQRVAQNLLLVEDMNVAFYQNDNTIHNHSQTLTIPTSDDVQTSLVMPDQSLNVQPLICGKTGEGDKPLSQNRYKISSLVDLTKDGEVTNLRFCGSSSLCRGYQQRERTGKLTVKDICMHFHLPIEAAAKKMNLCPSVLKKICRKGGFKRWPHRKIKCLERKITLVRTPTDEAVRAYAEVEIERLQKQIDKICNVK